MAAITHAVSTASTTNATSYVSGAFTPAAGDVLIAFVTATGTLATGTMTSSVAGQTFTKLTSSVYNSTTNTVYCFVLNNFTTAVSQTVTFDCTGDGATGSVIQVARISGLSRTGLGAIRQFATQNNQSPSTPSTVFAAACQTGNPTLGVVGNETNPATMTAPAGWTELNDTGYATPTTGAEYVGRDSGFTGTTVTWGSASAGDFATIIVEVDTTKQPEFAEVPVPARKRSLIQDVIPNVLLAVLLADAPVASVPRVSVGFEPQHKNTVVVQPPANVLNSLFAPTNIETFKNDVNTKVYKRNLTGDRDFQNNFVLYLVPPGNPVSSNPEFSSQRKKALSPNLFPGRGVNAAPPAETAFGTPFILNVFDQVQRHSIGSILFPSRGIAAAAPVVVPDPLPPRAPLFEPVQSKKVVYNLVHWNANTSTLDFEPIASSVPESLEPQRRKISYYGTQYDSLNTKLYSNLSQTFTFTVSGGYSFSGGAVYAKDKVLDAGGTLDFSGSAILSGTHHIEVSGGIEFTGVNTMDFLPEGISSTATKLPMTGAGQT